MSRRTNTIAIHSFDAQSGEKIATHHISRDVWVERYDGVDYGYLDNGDLIIVGNIVGIDTHDVIAIGNIQGIQGRAFPALDPTMKVAGLSLKSMRKESSRNAEIEP